MMWVKICANTTAEDALSAVEAGADAVGFVFAASTRQVNAEQARGMVDALAAGSTRRVEAVGVFGDPDAAAIAHAADAAELTAVQIHRSYTEARVRALAGLLAGVKLVQAVFYPLEAPDREAADALFVDELRAAAGDGNVWAVLVDAARKGVSGGLGVAFDAAHVGGLVRAAMEGREATRVVLAGGLRPDTVAAAAAQFSEAAGFQLFGVDVASGVEIAPGRKSVEKVAAFVAAAKAATRKGEPGETQESHPEAHAHSLPRGK